MSEAGFTRLESERLILRRFNASDLAPFLAYRNDSEGARYQAWDSYTEREAIAMIEELEALQPGTPGEWFQFAIELKKTGALIGDCALKAEEDGRQAEAGFTLSREHQGKGYASQAGDCLLDYALYAQAQDRALYERAVEELCVPGWAKQALPRRGRRAGLPERELEVLRLVAAGLTDPQVAQGLYISPRTVGWHLRSIYRKLRVPSRAAAAKEAVDRGLI